jgi:predicted nucleic acid-binding protein
MPATPTAVADSSVLLAAMRRRGEPAHEPAAAIVRAAGAERLELRVLDLTLYEIGNVIVRAWRAALQEHERALRALQALCGEPIVPALEDHIGAARIARDEGITLYDAMYVAIARRHGAALISLDERNLLSRELAISPTAATAQLLGSEKGRRSNAPTGSEN